MVSSKNNVCFLNGVVPFTRIVEVGTGGPAELHVSRAEGVEVTCADHGKEYGCLPYFQFQLFVAQSTVGKGKGLQLGDES